MRTFSDDQPLVWARTEGATIWDEAGREYLDLYAGFAVAAVGHCHPRVTEAITRQAGVMTHCPSAVPSRVRAELYERLVGIAPAGLDRALLAVTGAMANETAIQLARAATGRHTVIGFSGTYLGRTVGSVSHAGKHAYREQLRACRRPVPALSRSLPIAVGRWGRPRRAGARPARAAGLGPCLGRRSAGRHRRRAGAGQRRGRHPPGRLPARRPAPAGRQLRSAAGVRRDPVAASAAPAACGRASTTA